MPRAAGTRLDPYEVIALVGEGGMGEVYRARDPRLNRTVAIKTSREQFNGRFEREARAVAAISHPNLCHLYDVDSNYLVMEMVEGETLSGPVSPGRRPSDCQSDRAGARGGARKRHRASRPEAREYQDHA